MSFFKKFIVSVILSSSIIDVMAADKEQELVAALNELLTDEERAIYCNYTNENLDNPNKLVELKNFTPSYFFRNANKTGSEIYAAGTVGDESGSFHFNLETGEIRKVSSLKADPVPPLDHHLDGKIELLSFPALGRANDGLKIYEVDKTNKSQVVELKLLGANKNIVGYYQSFGLLEKFSNETTYNVLSDVGFKTYGGVNKGLGVAKLSIRGKNSDNLKVEFSAEATVCEDKMLQIPMISLDGSKVSALEYDENTETATTKIFDISANKCKEILDLGFPVAKVSFSPDGSKIAFSMPEEDTFLSKSTQYESKDLNDVHNIFMYDLVDKKITRLTNNRVGTSYFPIFTSNGTINYFYRTHVGEELKTFIGKVNPNESKSNAPQVLNVSDCVQQLGLHKELRWLTSIYAEVCRKSLPSSNSSISDQPFYQNNQKSSLIYSVLRKMSGPKCRVLINRLMTDKVQTLLSEHKDSMMKYSSDDYDLIDDLENSGIIIPSKATKEGLLDLCPL